MQEDEVKEILGYIDQLILNTKAGSMNWSNANPSTYVWANTTSKPARINIQRTRNIEAPSIKNGMQLTYTERYVLNALDGMQIIKFTADGGENSEINNKLGTLYGQIEASITRRGLNFLKSILPPGNS